MNIKSIIKEEVTNYVNENNISYSAVVLDHRSRSQLLQRVGSMIPEGWDIIAHHATINMGPLEDKSIIDKNIQLTVTDIGISDKAMAVKVKGFDTKNKIPHITIAVNRKDGGKPVMSNQITSWEPTQQFKIQGTVTEIPYNRPKPVKETNYYVTADQPQEVDENVDIKKKSKVEYGAVMLMVDVPNWKKIMSKIDPEDIYEVDGEFGFEKEPHVTILYGFGDDVTEQDVKEKLKTNNSSVDISLDGIGTFQNDEFDVVKIDIESPQLRQWNENLKELPYTETFPDFNPHMTIAYVKKGEGSKYVKKFKTAKTISAKKLVYADKNEVKHDIKLGSLNEDLEYWHVDGSADPESDSYRMGPETIGEAIVPLKSVTEDGTSLYAAVDGVVEPSDVPDDIELQEEYPSNWDMKEFKKINSFRGRMQYAAERLERISSGSGRVVYKIDDQKVLKIAKNRKGLTQNTQEESVSAHVDWYDHIVTKVYDTSPNDEWIEAELATKINAGRFRTLTGYDVKDVGKYLSYKYAQNHPRLRPYSHIHQLPEDMMAEMDDNEFIIDLHGLMADYDINPGDWGRISSYGEVKRHGQPAVVLVDYGLTKEYTGEGKMVYEEPINEMLVRDEKIGPFLIKNSDLYLNGKSVGTVYLGLKEFDGTKYYSLDEINVDPEQRGNRVFTRFMTALIKHVDANAAIISLTPEAMEGGDLTTNQLTTVYKRLGFIKNSGQNKDFKTRNTYIKYPTISPNDESLNEDIDDIDHLLHDNRMSFEEFGSLVAKQLGYSHTRLLGKGTMGVVFELNDDEVMKITSDKTEVSESYKLLNKNNERLANVYKIYHLEKPYENIYIIIREHLNVNPDKVKKMSRQSFSEYSEMVVPNYGEIEFYDGEHVLQDLRVDSTLDKNLIKTTEEIIAKLGKDKFPNTIEFLEMGKEIEKNNISGYDFAYSNFGFKDNDNLAFHDMGYSRATTTPNVDRLKITDGVMIEEMVMERIKKYMPGAQEVSIKKNCKLAGKGNTSDACNQGEIKNIELSPIKEDVRTLNPKNWDSFKLEKPIKLNDKLRVYHGFNKFDDALMAGKYGLSGQETAKRRYSYESGNNPKGLFVTVDFNVAKEFTGYAPMAIMEIDVLYKDLEAPTWVGGRGYYGQGEYTQSFSSDDERTNQMMKNRDRAKLSDDPRISQSDNPETAETLFGSESQALFVGNLNPNMIKYFWVRMEDNISKPFTRLDRKTFMEHYWKDEYLEKTYRTYKGSEKRKSDSQIEKSNKVFNPNDNLNMTKWKNKYKEYDYMDGWKEIVDSLKTKKMNYFTSDAIRTDLYPKQIQQLKTQFNISDEM